MSSLKIKIAYEDDIRIFKTTSDSIELLNKITLFIKQTHKIGTFRLLYKDEEDDEITIVDNDDLKEALNNNNSNKIPKLYVKKISKEVLESSSSSDETSPDEEEIELEYYGTKGWGVMFGGIHKPRHHRGHHKRHKHGRHHHGHHHRHHHGHHHKHHGHHGRKFGRRGGMHKHCGFKKFGRCQKDRDLRVDIINENISLNKDSFVNGGKYLIKTWKLKNVGKKIIPSNCNIEYFGRRFNFMVDNNKFELNNKEIDINEEFEVSIVVKSPKENGKYKSKWKLVTPDGKKFGQPLFVSFIVNDGNNTNYDNKILKKQEKLRHKKEKLLQKLQFLQQKSNELNSNNNDDKDDIKEEIEGNETQTSSDNGNLNENDIIIDEIYEIVRDDDEDKFIYGVQLEQLKNMGFNDENKFKKLLKLNNGNVEAVLNNIF